jgi:hypothetical protein
LDDWFTDRNERQKKPVTSPSDEQKEEEVIPEWASNAFKGLAFAAIALIISGLAFIVFLLLVKLGLWIWNL